MKTPTIQTRPDSLDAIDRVEAAASRCIGLLHLLSIAAATDSSAHGKSRQEAEGIRRLSSDVGEELADALKATFSAPAASIEIFPTASREHSKRRAM